MKYYKVNIGYEASVSIDETELEKVLKAQIQGGTVYTKKGIINTKYISLIVPDYNKAMGWNEDYKPQGDDFKYIETECKDYMAHLENVRNNLLDDGNKMLN